MQRENSSLAHARKLALGSEQVVEPASVSARGNSVVKQRARIFGLAKCQSIYLGGGNSRGLSR